MDNLLRLAPRHCYSNRGVLGHLTLHSCGAETLSSEENCVVVMLCMIRVGFLLHKCPAADVLKAP